MKVYIYEVLCMAFFISFGFSDADGNAAPYNDLNAISPLSYVLYVLPPLSTDPISKTAAERFVVVVGKYQTEGRGNDQSAQEAFSWVTEQGLEYDKAKFVETYGQAEVDSWKSGI